jgi:hypothetical protein
MRHLLLLACVVGCALLSSADAMAQSPGEVLRKLEQLTKGSKSSPRLAQIAQEIDALPLEPASRPKLATLIQELENLYTDLPSKEGATPIYQKWVNKYLDVGLVRVQKGEPGSKDFDDLPRNFKVVESILTTRLNNSSSDLAAKLEAVKSAYSAKLSQSTGAAPQAGNQKSERPQTAVVSPQESATKGRDLSIADMPPVIADVIRNPTRPSYESCRQRFSTTLQQDMCAAFLANPAAWRDQKVAIYLKASNDVTCNVEKAMSAETRAAMGKAAIDDIKSRCTPVRVPDTRLIAIANGAAPTSCQEFIWGLPNSQLEDGFSKWAVYAQPTGALRAINGELTNAKSPRFLIRQSQVQAELDVAENMNILSPMVSGRPTIVRKYAVIQVGPKTKVLGQPAQFGRQFSVVGNYRKNESLTMTTGEEVPAQVIEALCVEGG